MRLYRFNLSVTSEMKFEEEVNEKRESKAVKMRIFTVTSGIDVPWYFPQIILSDNRCIRKRVSSYNF